MFNAGSFQQGNPSVDGVPLGNAPQINACTRVGKAHLMVILQLYP